MIPVEYSTNNSGGSYWLDEKDWRGLQDAGWIVMDRDNAVYEGGNYLAGSNGLPTVSKPADLSQAHYAFKNFKGISEALEEFERITGQNVSDEGCNCCGAPHSFTWGRDIIVRLPKERLNEQDYNFASGEELLDYMYDPSSAHRTKRELLDLLKEKDSE